MHDHHRCRAGVACAIDDQYIKRRRKASQAIRKHLRLCEAHDRLLVYAGRRRLIRYIAGYPTSSLAFEPSLSAAKMSGRSYMQILALFEASFDATFCSAELEDEIARHQPGAAALNAVGMCWSF